MSSRRTDEDEDEDALYDERPSHTDTATASNNNQATTSASSSSSSSSSPPSLHTTPRWMFIIVAVLLAMVASLCGLVFQGGLGGGGGLWQDRGRFSRLTTLGREVDGLMPDIHILQRSVELVGQPSDLPQDGQGVFVDGRSEVDSETRRGGSMVGREGVSVVDQEGVSVVDHLVTSLQEDATGPLAAEIVRLDLTGDLTGVFDWEVLGRAEAVAATMDAPYVYYTPDLEPHTLEQSQQDEVRETPVDHPPIDTFDVLDQHTLSIGQQPDESLLETTTTTTHATTTPNSIIIPTITPIIRANPPSITPTIITSPGGLPIERDASPPPLFMEWLRGLDWGLHHLHHEEGTMAEYHHNSSERL